MLLRLNVGVGGCVIYAMQEMLNLVFYLTFVILQGFSQILQISNSPSAFALHKSDQRNCNESTDITRLHERNIYRIKTKVEFGENQVM